MIAPRLEALEAGILDLFDHVRRLHEAARLEDVILPPRPLRHEDLAPRARISAAEFLDAQTGVAPLEYGANGVAQRRIPAGREARFTVWVDRSMPLWVRVAFGRQVRATVRIEDQFWQIEPAAREPAAVGPLPPRKLAGPTTIVLSFPTVQPADSEQPDALLLSVEFEP